MTQPRRREARLKPEFAQLYPPLEAGAWDSASVMADRIIAWLLQQPNRGFVEPSRVLRPEHFEFRGGSPAPSDEPRSRREERESSGTDK